MGRGNVRTNVINRSFVVRSANQKDSVLFWIPVLWRAPKHYFVDFHFVYVNRLCNLPTREMIPRLNCDEPRVGDIQTASGFMPKTYADIEAQWEELAAKSSFPAEAKATYTAFMQFSAGLAVQSRCIHCGELLTVTELGERGTAWAVSCPCGRSKDTLRGLYR